MSDQVSHPYKTGKIQNLEYSPTGRGGASRSNTIQQLAATQQAALTKTPPAADSHLVPNTNYTHFTANYEWNVRGRHLDAGFMQLTLKECRNSRKRLRIAATLRLQHELRNGVTSSFVSSLPLVYLCVYGVEGSVSNPALAHLLIKRMRLLGSNFFHIQQIIQSAARHVLFCGPRPYFLNYVHTIKITQASSCRKPAAVNTWE